MNIRTVIILLVSLYTTRVIMSNLGIMDYGIFNVVAGFVVMFTFLNNSLAVASQRYYNFAMGKEGLVGATKVYNASWHIHFFLGIVIVCLAEIIGLIYLYNYMVLPIEKLPSAVMVFHSCVVSLFFLMISVPYSSAIMAHERMDYYAWIGVTDAVLKLIVAFIIKYTMGDRLVVYGWLLCGITVIDFIVYYVYAKYHFREIHLTFLNSNDKIRSMLSFTAWGVLGTLSYLIREQGVNLVINVFCGPVVNAARGIANQVNGALNGFVSNIIIPARPQIIQSYAQGDVSRSYALVFSISKMTFIFFYMMALPLAFTICFILRIWLGDNIPQHSDSFVILLLVSTAFSVLLQPISALMHADGNIRFYQITGCVTNLIAIPLAYIVMFMMHKPEYAFIALIASAILNYIAGIISVKRVMNFSVQLYAKNVLAPLGVLVAVTITIASVLQEIIETGMMEVILLIPAYILIVVVLAYIIVLEEQEKSFIKALVIKILHKK